MKGWNSAGLAPYKIWIKSVLARPYKPTHLIVSRNCLEKNMLMLATMNDTLTMTFYGVLLHVHLPCVKIAATDATMT